MLSSADYSEDELYQKAVPNADETLKSIPYICLMNKL
jgi:hypothetical protein